MEFGNIVGLIMYDAPVGQQYCKNVIGVNVSSQLYNTKLKSREEIVCFHKSVLLHWHATNWVDGFREILPGVCNKYALF